MSKKLRVVGHYVPEGRPKKSAPPGTIPDKKLGVFDHLGNLRGVMGPKAGAPVASRFLGHTNVKLGKVDNRPAWVGGSPQGRRNNAAQNQKAKLAKLRRTSKGSVGGNDEGRTGTRL